MPETSRASKDKPHETTGNVAEAEMAMKHAKGQHMRKKRLSPPVRHTIEAALKGEPFPGLVYRRGEFALAGNMLVLPGIGRIPFLGDVPPKRRIRSVTLQEEGDGWTATVEVEVDGE
jgi:hypothetical protein